MADENDDSWAPFADETDFDRMVAAVRYVERIQRSPNVLPAPLPTHPAPVLLRVIGPPDGSFYPAVQMFRNPAPGLPGETDWYDGEECRAVGLMDEPLILNKRYKGLCVGTTADGFGLVICTTASEDKIHYSITGWDGNNPGLYSGTRVKQVAPGGRWASFDPEETLTGRIARFPSNTISLFGVSPSQIPPFIDDGQVVEVKPDPDLAGFYYIVGACGSMKKLTLRHHTDCATTPPTTYYVDVAGRDLVASAPYAGAVSPPPTVPPPPPPPPPVTAGYYCVPDGAGGSACGYSDTTPPVIYGGPFATKVQCVNSCPTSPPPPPPPDAPPSWNCVPGVGCIDPGDGTGTYTTLADCTRSCLGIG